MVSNLEMHLDMVVRHGTHTYLWPMRSLQSSGLPPLVLGGAFKIWGRALFVTEPCGSHSQQQGCEIS